MDGCIKHTTCNLVHLLIWLMDTTELKVRVLQLGRAGVWTHNLMIYSQSLKHWTTTITLQVACIDLITSANELTPLKIVANQCKLVELVVVAQLLGVQVTDVHIPAPPNRLEGVLEQDPSAQLYPTSTKRSNVLSYMLCYTMYEMTVLLYSAINGKLTQ